MFIEDQRLICKKVLKIINFWNILGKYFIIKIIDRTTQDDNGTGHESVFCVVFKHQISYKRQWAGPRRSKSYFQSAFPIFGTAHDLKSPPKDPIIF